MKKSVVLCVVSMILLLLSGMALAEEELLITELAASENFDQTMKDFLNAGHRAKRVSEAQEADIEMMTYAQLTAAAQADEILPLGIDAGARGAVVIGGTPYGLIVKDYRTWFKVNEALWQELGLSVPQGTVTWERLSQAATAVMEHNQNAQEDLLLLSHTSRFERSAFLAQSSEARSEWASWSDIISGGDGEALLEEVVITLPQAGQGRYVTGISLSGETYPLSQREARCFAISAATDIPEAAQQFMQRFAENMAIDAAFSGVLSDGDAYDELCQVWNQNGVIPPSEENYLQWLKR